MITTAKKSPRDQFADIRARMEAVGDKLSALSDVAELSEAQQSEAAALTLEADQLRAEWKALHAKHPNAARITAPDPIRNTNGINRMTTTTAAPEAAAAYCKLHKRDYASLDTGGFQSFGELLSVFNSGRYDPRIQELQFRAASSGNIAGRGGILVPEKFVAESLHPPGESELIYPRASKFAMDVPVLNVSSLDNLSNASGEMYGGFTAEWVEEGGEFTDQTPTTSGIKLTRRKLGLFTTASNELVSDSQFESMLVPALQAAMQDFRDYAFFRGTGSGQPKGILNDAALITVAKETSQAADTIVIDNLDKMYARLHPRLVRNARWYANPTCIPALLSLVRAIGTGGTTVPVLNEQNGTFSMYGLPVELTSKLPVLGDAGDILLADVSQYAVGFGREVTIDRSEHFKFQNDQTVWRAIWRGDGQGRWRAAYTPRNGNTLSWCVTLAARA